MTSFMRTARLPVLALSAALAVAACEDEKTAAMTPAPAGMTPGGAPMTPPAPMPGTMPGTTPPAAGGPVPITAWIHDLVKSYGPMSAPDTVDDKNLIDTEDDKAFDSLLE